MEERHDDPLEPEAEEQYAERLSEAIKDLPDGEEVEEEQYAERLNDAIRRMEAPEPDLIATVLPQRKFLLVSAAEKHGKSYMVDDMCEAVATGTPWLGHYPVLAPGPVVLFSIENGRAETIRRWTKRGYDQHETPEIYLKYALDLSSAQKVKSLASDLRQYHPHLVVIDLLTPAMVGLKSWNSGAEVRQRLEPLVELARDNFTVVGIVHDNKKGGVAGSVQLPGTADGIIRITKKEELPNRDLRLWVNVSGRGEMAGNIVIEMDHMTYRFRLLDGNVDVPVTVADKQAHLAGKMQRYISIARSIINRGSLATSVEISEDTTLQLRTTQMAIKEMREEGMARDSGKRAGARAPLPLYALTTVMDKFVRQNYPGDQFVDYGEAARNWLEWADKHLIP